MDFVQAVAAIIQLAVIAEMFGLSREDFVSFLANAEIDEKPIAERELLWYYVLLCGRQ
ncbi:MAG: hypothetical protein AB7P69_14395 [Candidatus Binatia bacterium]